MKRILSILLVICMVFALAACGKEKAEDAPSSAAAAPVSSGNKANAEPTPAPEYTYKASYKEIVVPEEAARSAFLSMTEDGFYFSLNEKVGSALREGELTEYEGDGDIFAAYLGFMDFDGNFAKLPNFEPLAVPELTEEMYNVDVGTYINGVTRTEDGFVVTENRYLSYFDAPDITWNSADADSHFVSQSEFIIRQLDEDGAELSSAVIPLGTNEYINFSNKLDPDGNLLGVKDVFLVAFSPEGEEAYSIECGEWIDSVVELGSGDLAVTYWGDSGEIIARIDFAGKQLEKGIPLPGYSYNPSKGDAEYDLYFTDGNNFKGFRMETGEATTLFNWLDCDVDPNFLNYVTVSPDGTITALDNSANVVTAAGGAALQEMKYSVITLEKVPYDSVAHKQELTLATQGLGWDVQTAIIDFNRTNPDYRIKVIDYSEYNTPDDYTAGALKMKTELLAGNMPDIIDLSSMPVGQMASKNMLEDLTPYIDADAELDMNDFFPNVIEAAKQGGKLVSTVSGFYIITAMGATAVVGDEPGWTYDEFNAALAEMPAGCQPFEQFTTKRDFLSSCLQYSVDDFVDWSTGEVNFDNPEFINLLKFANSFPEEFNWETYGENGEEDYLENRLASGKQMLMSEYMFGLDTLLYEVYYFGGKDVTFVGYPSVSGEGNGSVIGLSTGYGMSTSCADKDAAWQFLRTFFTKDYMRQNYQFPLSRSLFDEQLKNFTEIQYQKTDDGSYLLDENGEKIPIVRYTYAPGNGQESVPVYNLSDDLAEKVVALIEGTTRVANYDTTITDIVKEDCEAYFSGQKSAEDVAKLIQSKVNIYVNEQR